MGTRADFYIGRDKSAEWLGSIAMDGYPDDPGHPKVLRDVNSKDDFRSRVDEILTVEHATHPQQGWPWPWDNSATTDYAYAFDDAEKAVYVSRFGGPWVNARSLSINEEPEFPDMSDRKNLTLGKRSGVIVVGGR